MAQTIDELIQCITRANKDRRKIDACVAIFIGDGGKVFPITEGGKVFADDQGGKVFVGNSGKITGLD